MFRRGEGTSAYRFIHDLSPLKRVIFATLINFFTRSVQLLYSQNVCLFFVSYHAQKVYRVYARRRQVIYNILIIALIEFHEPRRSLCRGSYYLNIIAHVWSPIVTEKIARIVYHFYIYTHIFRNLNIFVFAGAFVLINIFS